MINPVSHAQPQAVEQTAAAQAAPQKAQATPAPAPAATLPTDTVNISSTAAAMAKELNETAAQTAKEAAGGDHQAQRLLAREEAERK
jgi:hypothetical protein